MNNSGLSLFPPSMAYTGGLLPKAGLPTIWIAPSYLECNQYAPNEDAHQPV
jgi:hypothetical protein